MLIETEGREKNGIRQGKLIAKTITRTLHGMHLRHST